MILKMPRAVDRKARDVGTHDWKAEEKLTRYWLVGVQCSGRLVQVLSSDDSVIMALFRFSGEGRHASDPSVCYCNREIEIIDSLLLELMMWSNRTAAAELTATYESFGEYLPRTDEMMKL